MFLGKYTLTTSKNVLYNNFCMDYVFPLSFNFIICMIFRFKQYIFVLPSLSMRFFHILLPKPMAVTQCAKHCDYKSKPTTYKHTQPQKY